MRRDFRSDSHKLRLMSDAEKFWHKVQKSDGCWTWLGCRNRDGYGLANRKARASGLAHRISYEMAYGAIPQGDVLVCHHCDNPACVRPDHLFLGTSADNTHDSQAKGRLVKDARGRFQLSVNAS